MGKHNRSADTTISNMSSVESVDQLIDNETNHAIHKSNKHKHNKLDKHKSSTTLSTDSSNVVTEKPHKKHKHNGSVSKPSIDRTPNNITTEHEKTDKPIDNDIPNTNTSSIDDVDTSDKTVHH